MNERIKELWNKAAESTAANASGQNNSWETQVNFIDKFAELIVQECVTICNDTNDASYLNGVIAGRKIKEHFGVKE